MAFKLSSKKLCANVVLIAGIVLFASTLVLSIFTTTSAEAAVVGDDYPIKWKKIEPFPSNVQDDWGMFVRQCVSFVAWRLHSQSGFDIPRGTYSDWNASVWGVNAKKLLYKVDSIPAVGAVAWGSGHVAWVAEVNGSTVTLEDYNHYKNGTSGPTDGAYHKYSVPASTYQYIHFKDLAGSAIADGTFVKQAEKDTVYVVAGGALIPLPNWKSVGGAKSVAMIPSGTVALGKYKGYPSDGTYVKQYGTKTVYVMAGGAAIPLPSWDSVGKSKPVVTIPSGTATMKRFRAYPSDGTYVKQYGTKTVYVITGGIAKPLSSWASVGGEKPFVTIPSGESTKKKYLVSNT